MSWKTVVFIVVVCLTACGLGYLCVKQYTRNKNLSSLLDQKVSELQQANLKLGRAETKLGEANEMIDKLNKDIQDEIKKREAMVKLYAELKAAYEAEKKNVKIVTKVVYKDKEIDIPAGKIFVKTEDGQYQEVTSMLFNYEDFRLTLQGDAIKQTLSYRLHQKFRGIFIEIELPGGTKNHYAEIYEIDADGKDVGRLELTDFTVIKSKDAVARLFWWNPKLDISLGFGMGSGGYGWTGMLGFSTSAYGVTPDDLSWRFVRLSAGIMDGKDFAIEFSPLQWNAAKYIPLISNLWISPSIGWNITGFNSWYTALSLGVVL